jgi:hypothetical protein
MCRRNASGSAIFSSSNTRAASVSTVSSARTSIRRCRITGPWSYSLST